MRRRFQIHLSTAVVMMIAVGILMYLNARSDAVLRNYHYVREYGWPLTAVESTKFERALGPGGVGVWEDERVENEISILAMGTDICFTALMLYTIWFLFERSFIAARRNRR